MKSQTLTLAAMALAVAAWPGLTGCGTTPANPLAAQSSPALAGGMQVVERFEEKAQVTSLMPEQRGLALRSEAGDTIKCKAAPQVTNYSQLRVGDMVEATVTDVVAIYPVKKGPPPSAGTGVEVAGQEAGMVLQTTDTRARVFQVDRSYRLLRLDYGNGFMREFKIPMRYKLKEVRSGDEVVVRATEALALRVEPR